MVFFPRRFNRRRTDLALPTIPSALSSGPSLRCRLIGAAPHSSAATPKAVEESVAKAKAFIYGRQNKDGTWETADAPRRMPGLVEARARVDGAQWGGLTALSTYALISAGENPADPKLARAVAFLKTARLVGTYALSMRAQVWSVLPQGGSTSQDPQDNAVRNKARADATALAGGMVREGRGRGFYNYVVNDAAYPVLGWWWDLSNGQIAVLGVWACDRALDPNGLHLDQEYWKTVDLAWRGTQYPSGAWRYSTADPGDFSARPRMSMTAAGVATLFITDEYLHRTEGLDCKGYFKDESVENGIGYLADHFKDLTDAPVPDCYAMYGLERIGVASGRRYFETAPRDAAATRPVKVDWYRQGADYLVGRQNDDGSWGKDDAGEPRSLNPMKLPDTCFATIFLSRGRAGGV